MEKDIALGKVGTLDLSFSGGKANLSLVTTFGTTVTITEDASVLLALLESAIQKALPNESGIIAAVFGAIGPTIIAL